MSLLAITQIITGLGAGFFFTWSVTVIPGTKKISDAAYLETMQSINKQIINPVFFVIFFGPGAFLLFQARSFEAIPVVAALAYLLGAIGVTMTKNVPLNDKLEATDLTKLSDLEKQDFRKRYEPAWNHWHYVRTAFSMLSFLLVVIC